MNRTLFLKNYFRPFVVGATLLGTASASAAACEAVHEKGKGRFSMWIWGDNANRIVSKSKKQTHFVTPINSKSELFSKTGLRQVVFGHNFAAAVDANGDVYGWGAAFGQGFDVSHPQLLLKGGNVQSISCTVDRILALSGSGKLYPVSVSADTIQNPLVVGWFTGPATLDLPSNKKIFKVDSSEHHILALDTEGKIYTCSNDSDGNLEGQLGQGDAGKVVDEVRKRFLPVKIEQFEKEKKRADYITDIACGSNHSVFLTHHGRVFSFGSDKNLQLCAGKQETQYLSYSPSPIRAVFPSNELGQDDYMFATRIFAGGDNTMIIRENDEFSEVLMAGVGQFGQLGTGTWVHARGTPIQIGLLSRKLFWDKEERKTKTLSVNYASIGNGHVFVEMNDGNTYCWGLNRNGELGNGQISNHSKPIVAYTTNEQQREKGLYAKKIPNDERLRFIAGYNNTCCFTVV